MVLSRTLIGYLGNDEKLILYPHSQILLLACAYWLVRKGLAINHLQTAENEKTRTKSFLI